MTRKRRTLFLHCCCHGPYPSFHNSCQAGEGVVCLLVTHNVKRLHAVSLSLSSKQNPRCTHHGKTIVVKQGYDKGILQGASAVRRMNHSSFHASTFALLWKTPKRQKTCQCCCRHGKRLAFHDGCHIAVLLPSGCHQSSQHDFCEEDVWLSPRFAT